MEISANYQTVAAEEDENVIVTVGEENPFNRLPEYVIIYKIFEKISEAKILCRCSLVSKHFCSLVYQCHKVSFKLPLLPIPFIIDNQENPGNQNPPPTLPQRVLHLISRPFRLIHGLLHSVVRGSPTPSSDKSDVNFFADRIEFFTQVTTSFLGKFTSLKSVDVEFDFYGGRSLEEDEEEPLVKWIIDSEPGCFVILVAKSIHLATEGEGGDYNGIANEAEVNEDENFVRAGFMYYLVQGLCWFTLMNGLVPLWPKEIESVVVTDTKKQGRLQLGDEILAEMRNPNRIEEDEAIKVRVWRAPVLKLPYSSCVIKRAMLFMINDDEVDNELIAKEAFEGEEEIYGEAAIELLKREADLEINLQIVVESNIE